jgi:GNAT superfamily N-acetyltransferase
MHASQHTGLAALTALTRLLQRTRLAHPTWGALEAADLHWWWRLDARADAADCLVWSDAEGPCAAVVASRLRDRVLADILRLPGAPVTGAMLHAAQALRARHAASTVEWACPEGDEVLDQALRLLGLQPTDECMVEMGMACADAAMLAPPDLPPGYRLERRSEQPPGTPHHLAARNGGEVARRLREAPLYRADFDLLVRAIDSTVAGYAVFWADPVTRVGLVEPVRVEQAHGGLGLARALVATGVRMLAQAGCTRAKVAHEAGNAAAGRAYRSAGFSVQGVTRTYA